MESAGPIRGRIQLLEASVAHLAERGTHDFTLRQLAAAVGTSHRMLLYHFGSRDGLLVAVAREVERRQRLGLSELVADERTSPVAVMWQMYERIADPDLWPQERLFFDLLARALHGDSGAQPLLEGDVDAWVDALAVLFRRLGFDADHARAEARLAVAVARGLLLDLLANGDREATDRAMAAYVARFE